MAPLTMPHVICGFCAQAFEQDLGQPVCRMCPLAGSCHHVRCPHCGYENPVPPAWLRRLSGAARP
ncbi:MAG: hypothetical protein ACREMI_05730 [Gemmatimonadales bacterium]